LKLSCGPVKLGLSLYQVEGVIDKKLICG